MHAWTNRTKTVCLQSHYVGRRHINIIRKVQSHKNCHISAICGEATYKHISNVTIIEIKMAAHLHVGAAYFVCCV